MPDRLLVHPRRTVDPLVAAAQVIGSAQLSDRKIFQNESWQSEAWGFFDSLGEFNFGVMWLGQALSRVRLTAAEQVPGGDEPEPLTEGPAADIVEQLGGGIGGRAAIMESLGVQVSVPGEGWVVAEREKTSTPLNLATWTVRSTDEIRPVAGARTIQFEVRDGETVWRTLPGEALVCRIHKPHKRWSWRADSSARSAIPIMREIDLYNRRIIATMVSRLAMNGLLLIPQEATVTVPQQYADAPDPFVQMLIEVAANNIKNPGSASASIPIPVRFPSEFIEKWKHLTFGDGVDEPLLAAREKAIGRLATTLNMPAEVLTGLGDTSHWNAWQLEETGIKLHISPLAETIVGGLTVGYLHPMLKAAKQELVGPNGGKLVVWYDPSELTARPDKSAQALNAYDRLEISGTALRRESGFDESDAPDKKELAQQALKKLLGQPATALDVYAKLVGEKPPTPQAPVSGAPQPSGPGGDGGGVEGSPPPPPAEAPDTGPPSTKGNPPPPPGGGTPKKAAPAAKRAAPTTAAGVNHATLPPYPPVNGRPPVLAVNGNGHGPAPRRRR